MNVPFFIARRYFFSKKTSNFINIITSISFVGVMIGTAALVVVLSTFNGLEDLVSSLFNKFDPDLKIETKKGKVFTLDSLAYRNISAIGGVEHIELILEENALIRHKNNEYIATLKGVGQNFGAVRHVDSSLVEGQFALQSTDSTAMGVLGIGVAYQLDVSLNDVFSPISIYLPKRNGKIGSALNATNAFNKAFVYASGIFSIQPEIDGKYLIVPIDFVRNLLEYKASEVSSIEIGLVQGSDAAHIQAQIAAVLGNRFSVKNRFEQQEAVYKVFRSEKWWSFAILCLMVLLTTLNLIGTLTMLVIEKQKDIAILDSFGASKHTIGAIFLLEGLFVTAVGVGLGVLVGVGLCLMQSYFGFIGLPDANSFIVKSYPVSVRFYDVLLISATVLCLGVLCSLYPAYQASRQNHSKYL